MIFMETENFNNHGFLIFLINNKINIFFIFVSTRHCFGTTIKIILTKLVGLSNFNTLHRFIPYDYSFAS